MRKKNKKRKYNLHSKKSYRFPFFIILLIVLFAAILDRGSSNTPAKKDGKIFKSFPVTSSIQTLKVPIILYHYVEYVKDTKDTIRKSLSVPPNVFVKQLETLKNANFTFITASDLADIMDGKINIPDNPIILTFDDGYKDFYTDVFPILKEFKVKAVAYVVSDFIDKPNFMTASQIKEIAQSGLIEIGGHTVHHGYLKGLPKEEAVLEISNSKEILGKMLGIPIVSFAYPYGAFDDQAIKLVKDAGFKTAVTTIQGIEATQDNRYKLPRIRLGQKFGNEALDFLYKYVAK